MSFQNVETIFIANPGFNARSLPGLEEANSRLIWEGMMVDVEMPIRIAAG